VVTEGQQRCVDSRVDQLQSSALPVLVECCVEGERQDEKGSSYKSKSRSDPDEHKQSKVKSVRRGARNQRAGMHVETQEQARRRSGIDQPVCGLIHV
jgi:hypothetical protein